MGCSDSKAIETDRPSIKAQRLLLIASSVHDANILGAAALSTVTVAQYDWENDTLDSLLALIRGAERHGQKRFHTIAIACHGKPGVLELLSSSPMTSQSLQEDTVKTFWSELSELAEIRVDLLACDLTANEQGSEFVDRLEKITKKNFAASDDKTGAGSAGIDTEDDSGDFMLETDGVDATDLYFDRERLKLWNHKLFVGAVLHGCVAVYKYGKGDKKGAQASAGKAAMSLATAGLTDLLM